MSRLLVGQQNSLNVLLIIIKYVPGGGVVGISKVFADVSSVGVSLEGAEGSGGAGVLAADASFGGGASPIRERFTNQWLEIKLLFSTLTLAVPDVLTAVTVMNMFHVICFTERSRARAVYYHQHPWLAPSGRATCMKQSLCVQSQ